MPESEIDITNIDGKGWFGKIKDWSYENWQTILVILIVLIVGISAYNYNQKKSSPSGELSPATTVNENGSESGLESSNIENKQESAEAAVENKDEKIASEEDNKTNPNSGTSGALNENTNKNSEEKESVAVSSDDSGKTYTVSAKSGEGITHLARHALEKYLQETGGGSELTQEHKIYIEDYIQNRTGNEKINIGHTKTFSESLIKEAISSANYLSPKSLENLKKYIVK